MPAGASTASLGALGLRACGDTIPGLWQDHPLPAVCAVARSEAHICPSHPACVDICDWGEAGMVAMSIAPLPCPYNLPDPHPGSFTLPEAPPLGACSHWKAFR